MIKIPEDIKKIYLGLSGGIDSMVLLDLLAKQSLEIIAIHINHGLQPNAQATSAICAATCKKYNVELITVNLANLDKISKNKEQAYRNARYQAFIEHMPTNAYLVLAHHAGDQLETRIKRIMTGATKIAGMQYLSKRSGIYILRPMLATPKAKIIEYADKHKLIWLEDPSNTDISFERNYIRHKIIPNLKQQWPALEQTMQTLTEKISHSLTVTAEIAESDLANILINGKLDIKKLKVLSQARQTNCWQYYLRANNLELDTKAYLSFYNQCLKSPRVNLTREIIWLQHNGYGWLQTSLPTRKDIYKITETLPLLQLNRNEQGHLRPPNADEVTTIRFRKPGQIVKLHQKQHHQKLKKLMQEWQIPEYLRDYWPLIYYNEILACIPGYGICAGFYCDSGLEFTVNIENPASILEL